MIPPRRSPEEAKKSVLRAETIGILIFVLAGVALVLIRFGRYIDWHAR